MFGEIDKMDERNRLSDLDILVRKNKVAPGHAVKVDDMLRSSTSSQGGIRASANVEMLKNDFTGFHDDEKDHNHANVSRLFQKLHQTEADLRGSELKLNHVRLQVQALSRAELQLRQERDGLQYAIAEYEQDKMLLEARLQDIAGFEGVHASSSLENLRGQLLHIATNKIADLVDALNSQEASSRTNDIARQAESLRFENKALREEIAHMGNQLAQRTVLYSAQERRLHDSSRASTALHAEKETEVTQLRARLQQLEQRYELVDRERLEAVFSERQGKEARRSLDNELAHSMERAQQLDAELTAVTTRNISLQAAVEHLRGANFDEIERDLAANVEAIRAEADNREGQFKLQLETARTLLEQEAARRERLLDEVAMLRRELNDKSQLLEELSHLGMGYTPHETALPEDEFEDVSPIMSPVLAHEGSTSGLYAAMFDDAEDSPPRSVYVDAPNVDVPNSLSGAYLSNATLQTLSSLLEELARGSGSDTDSGSTDSNSLLALINNQKGEIEVDDSSSPLGAFSLRVQQAIKQSYAALSTSGSAGSWSDIFRSVLRILRGVAQQRVQMEQEITQRVLNESFMLSRTSADRSQSVSQGFLMGLDESGKHSNERMSNDDQSLRSAALEEELSCLKDELVKRKRRERELQGVVKQQEQALAEVVHTQAPMHQSEQAAEHSAAGAKNSKSLIVMQEHSIKCLESERDILQQKMSGYIDEIQCLQQQADLNRGVGYHEASELHSKRILELEGLLQSAQVELLEFKAKASVSVIPQPSLTLTFSQEDVRVQVEVKAAELLATHSAKLETLSLRHKDELTSLRAALSTEHADFVERERSRLQQQMQCLVESLKQDHIDEVTRLKAAFSRPSSTSLGVNTDELESTVFARRAEGSAGAVSLKDSAAQTSFNIADSQVDQRIEFAMAHQRLQDANKHRHELEMQKLTLERAHQIDIHDKIATLHQEYETQLVLTRQKVSSKYRTLLDKQRQQFDYIKVQLMEAVKLEQESLRGQISVGGQGMSSHLGAVGLNQTDISLDSENAIWSVRSSQESSVSQRSPDISAVEVDIGGEEAEVDTSSDSKADSAATLSPPRWVAVAESPSVAAIMQTPVLERMAKAANKLARPSANGTNGRVLSRKPKASDVSPISLKKTRSSDDKFAIGRTRDIRRLELSEANLGEQLKYMGSRKLPADIPRFA